MLVLEVANLNISLKLQFEKICETLGRSQRNDAEQWAGPDFFTYLNPWTYSPEHRLREETDTRGAG